MTADQWTLDGADGDLLLHTGVTGTAARMGHRLTIAMRSWLATVDVDEGEPSAVEMTVDLNSLDVLTGEGGMTPLSGSEKTLVRANALKTLQTKRFPQAKFRSSAIERSDDGWRLVGTLDLGGRSSEQTVVVQVARDGADWVVTGRVTGDFPGSPVTLRAAAEGALLGIEISDRGIGIAPADVQQLFTPFFRSDRSRNRSTGGVGLGLVLSRRIAEAHGGTLTIQSDLTTGTTARFLLPRPRPESLRPPASRPASRPTSRPTSR